MVSEPEGLAARFFLYDPDHQKSRTRASLLSSMAELAARDGFDRASPDLIASSSGIARSTFYEHFADKAQCFNAVLAAVSEQVRSVLSADRAAGETGLGTPLSALLDFVEAERDAARLLFSESLAAGGPALAARESARTALEAALRRACAEEAERGRNLDAQIDALAGTVFRLIAIRFSHQEPHFAGLAGELRAWIDSYLLGEASLPPGYRAPGPGFEPLPATSGGFSTRERGPGEAVLLAAEPGPDQRQRILEALTRSVFGCRYASVTVADIVEEAGVSRKTFYRHFADKEAAGLAAAGAVFQGGMAACAGAFFGPSSWPERAWEGGAALLRFLAANPEGAYLAFVEGPALGRSAATRVYEWLSAFTLFLEEGFRTSPRAEELPAVVPEALMSSMFESAFAKLRASRNASALLEAMPEFNYVIQAPFLGAEAARAFVERKTAEASGE